MAKINLVIQKKEKVTEIIGDSHIDESKKYNKAIALSTTTPCHRKEARHCRIYRLNDQIQMIMLVTYEAMMHLI
uniref:Uncharacterized protein n=1 Tax=Rhizophora mucronata TaxID=61149 RepID=A0A2P2QE21_RHIMU